jgi:hypothetical protein
MALSQRQQVAFMFESHWAAMGLSTHVIVVQLATQIDRLAVWLI